ncbi:glycogenin-1-like isoform X1 [Clavelina lepadiformis]|uniref:glycogenin-1-like isoform X1 n=1 Tax=Clavelina lepadiformis TaxID=159417 RepID=UPI00404177FD
MDEGNDREAFVTLATNNSYSQGAMVLAQSLRRHGTLKEIVVLVTPQISLDVRHKLETLFDRVVLVDVMDSEDEAHLSLLNRPELGVTFTKFHCWNLTEYNKCVFMDADTMALTNIDELFNREELSAAPDAGWPDMFNSGVFVYKPSRETYLALISLADSEGSFDGGDQGLLNTYFNKWSTSGPSKRLSFLYNMHSTATYTYSPAFARFGKDTKVVHFIGAVKPWHHTYDFANDVLHQAEGPGIHEEVFIKQWWRLFAESADKIRELEQEMHYISLTPSEQSESRDFSQASLVDASQEDVASIHSNEEKFERERFEEQRAHHFLWQTSQVDYAGQDSFANIQAKMDDVLQNDTSVSSGVSSPSAPSSIADQTPYQPYFVADENRSGGDEIISDVMSDITLDDLTDEEEEEEAKWPPPPADKKHFQMWKEGTSDYQGRDKFANIQARIDSMLLYAEFGDAGAPAHTNDNAESMKQIPVITLSLAEPEVETDFNTHDSKESKVAEKESQQEEGGPEPSSETTTQTEGEVQIEENKLESLDSENGIAENQEEILSENTSTNFAIQE